MIRMLRPNRDGGWAFDDGFDYFGPVDEHGEPVQRTKQSHPYSYDGFVLHRLGRNEEATMTVYSDRLAQWDDEKYVQCCERHMPGKRWDNASPEQIQAFLRDYTGEPALRLILVMEYCNYASGYPVWRFDYATPPKPTEGAL